MTKETKLAEEFIAMRNAINALIKQCPDFPGAPALVNEVAVRMANVESQLHWYFDCWELATPDLNIPPKKDTTL